MELTSDLFNTPQQFAKVMVQQAMFYNNEGWSTLSSAILRDMLDQGKITHAELDEIVDQQKQFAQANWI